MLRKPFLVSELSRAMANALAESRGPSAHNIVRLQSARRGQTPGAKRNDPA